MDIRSIQNAFSPAEEIMDPHLFVGRKEQIRDAMLALNNTGSFLAIYGLRGVGKSSIARQLCLIAEGNEVLPKMLDLERYLPKNDGFDFIVQYIRCDSSVKTSLDLLKRIMFGEGADSSLFEY